MRVRYFVFVEFTDPKVRQFMDELREALSGHISTDAPHITVRGPYTTRPDTSLLEEWKENLSGQGIMLVDPGVFKTPKGYAVFLHAKSKIFDNIWWKPDYKGPKSSRKPHLTIFETKSSYSAGLVRNFLETENISIFTLGVDLTVYTSRQHELLGYNFESVNQTYARSQPERIIFREGIIDRARKLYAHIAEHEKLTPFQPMLF